MNWNGSKMSTTPIVNTWQTAGRSLGAVMVTAVCLGHQPSLGIASDALKAQSTTTTSPDVDRGTTVEPGPDDKLYGAWIANDVDSKMGEVKIKLVFRRVGTMRLLAWSDIPFVGKVEDLKGPYEVQGDTISSEAIRGGTTAKYSFDGEQLLLQFEDGKVVRFHREER